MVERCLEDRAPFLYAPCPIEMIRVIDGLGACGRVSGGSLGTIVMLQDLMRLMYGPGRALMHDPPH